MGFKNYFFTYLDRYIKGFQPKAALTGTDLALFWILPSKLAEQNSNWSQIRDALDWKPFSWYYTSTPRSINFRVKNSSSYEGTKSTTALTSM